MTKRAIGRDVGHLIEITPLAARDGTHWSFETKRQETPEVQRKDEAAQRWLGRRYRRYRDPVAVPQMPQKQFEQLQAATLADLVVTTRFAAVIWSVSSTRS